MITEAQRRALFALREALHLCDVAGMTVSEVIGGVGVYDSNVRQMFSSASEDLLTTDVDTFLAEQCLDV